MAQATGAQNPIRVLIVDDSVVFRTQITSALNGIPGIEVAGTAASGSIALQKLAQLSVDAVTIDMEMPEMDGIGLIREIRARGFLVKTIVFSSQTTHGAQRALEALSEGANDIVAKPTMTSGGEPAQLIREALAPKILQFLDRSPTREVPEKKPAIASPSWERPLSRTDERYKKVSLEAMSPAAIVIASSTGGPSALEEIFSKLGKIPKVPVLIAQHMPPVFTGILASRIGQFSDIPTVEGVHDAPILPGRIYIAPGDFHMQVTGTAQNPKIGLNKLPSRNSVRPAADYLFESASAVFAGKVIGIVLTGMGEDGLVGSIAIKNAGGGIFIQDKQSCVVFGMPGAIAAEGSFDRMGDLGAITEFLGLFSKPK